MFLDRMIHYHVSCISSSPSSGPPFCYSTLSPLVLLPSLSSAHFFPTLTNSNLFQVLLILL